MASSSPPSQKAYDVYISFRGEDTRRNFVSHLVTALREKSVHVFLDDEELNKGDEIAQAFRRAIEGSKISLVVFSQNYASSIWCLDELVQIMECKNIKGQIVMPIFYNVDPSDVRRQKGTYKCAIAKHEKRADQSRLVKWRTALLEAANLSGWVSASRSDSELIGNIVQDILQKLNYMINPSHQRELFGIDEQIKALEALLCTGSNDVRMVGIWGMSGIGKTTLAKAVFNQLFSQFQAHCFVEDVREYWNNRNHDLRHKLLTEILGEETPPHISSTFVVDQLSNKKILIVLDDVSQQQQIEDLAGKKNWYGPGSRIIVTSRDKSVLQYECDELYEAKRLDSDEAHKLFCMHAFQQVQPKSEFKHLTDVAVHYAGDIPLILKMLGLHLHSKDREEWESAIQKMKKVQVTNICNKLHLTL